MIEELKNKKIKVNISETEQVIVKYGTKACEVLSLLDMDSKDILAVKVNNSIRNLDYELCENSNIIPVRYDSSDGYRIYIRTVKFMLYMALKRLYPDLDIEVCNTIDGTIYFICKNMEFTGDMAVELLKEMRTIVKNDAKFTRRLVSFEEAKYLFEASKNLSALDSMAIRMSPYTTIHTAEDICGLTDGILAPSASYTPDFNIKKYRRGFALIVPKQEDRKVIAEKINDSPLYSVFEERSDFLDIIKVRSVSELNTRVINSDMSDIIRVNEAEHNRKFAELVRDIQKKERVRLILIAGPSSSGKTTFAKRLSTNLKTVGYNPRVISMDNYFKERVDTPLQPNGEYDFETIDALDLKLFNSDMKKLFGGKKINMPEFNFFTGCKEYPGNYLKLEENDVIILEGIHALNPILLKDIDDELKYKIYIAPMTTLSIDDFSKVSTTDTRMLRRILRDYKTRGHEVEKTFGMWSNLMRGETKYIYPYIKYADYIFNTSFVYEIGAIRTFVEPLLLKVDTSSPYFSEARRLYHFIQKFLPIETTEIPADSIIREFIGNSSFQR